MSHRNALPSGWDLPVWDNKRRKNLSGFPNLSGDEGRYLIDRAFDNARRVTPYEYEWSKENPDGSREIRRERGVRIDLQKEDVREYARNIINNNKEVFDRLANL
jgi:hypothetical protein